MVNVQLSLKDSLIEQADAVAIRLLMSREDLLVLALEYYLRAQQNCHIEDIREDRSQSEVSDRPKAYAHGEQTREINVALAEIEAYSTEEDRKEDQITREMLRHFAQKTLERNVW